MLLKVDHRIATDLRELCGSLCHPLAQKLARSVQRGGWHRRPIRRCFVATLFTNARRQCGLLLRGGPLRFGGGHQGV